MPAPETQSTWRLSRALTFLLLIQMACWPPTPRLEPNLCLDVAGIQPDYGTRLPTAAPAAPRPMLKLTLKGARSHCNDGSPAVAFVRPAPEGSAHADDWIIFFDGGGSCADPEACLDRFCSLGPSPAVFDVAGKRSSLGQPDAIDPPEGLFSWSAANEFAEYNHVLMAYCSSDSWIGSSDKKEITTASGIGYEIEFRGQDIVYDLIGTLSDGPTWADPRGATRYYNEPMPDLDLASRVIFAGESAGSNGLRHHVDALAAFVTASNVNPAGVEVLALADAALSPALFDPAVVWNPPASPLDYDDMGITQLRPRIDFWEAHPSALDRSCMASGVPDYYCMDTVYTLLNEISTPVFVRADLTDHLLEDRVVTAWGLYASAEVLAQETASEFGNLPAGSGAFGPNCNGHVMVQNDGFATTTTDGGTGLTFHDLFANWVNGVGPTVDVQSDFLGAGAYSPSVSCP